MHIIGYNRVIFTQGTQTLINFKRESLLQTLFLNQKCDFQTKPLHSFCYQNKIQEFIICNLCSIFINNQFNKFLNNSNVHTVSFLFFEQSLFGGIEIKRVEFLFWIFVNIDNAICKFDCFLLNLSIVILILVSLMIPWNFIECTLFIWKIKWFIMIELLLLLLQLNIFLIVFVFNLILLFTAESLWLTKNTYSLFILTLNGNECKITRFQYLT